MFNGRENIVGKKIVNLDSVKKAINDEDVNDDTLPYAGYKVWIMCFVFLSIISGDNSPWSQACAIREFLFGYK